LADQNGFALDSFPDSTKACKRPSKGQCLLFIVGQTLRQVVGPSGLLVAIIAHRSFAVSVLVWGWGKNKKLILVLRNIVFHGQYTQSTCGAALKEDFSNIKMCL
jgi:hypothetical protein